MRTYHIYTLSNPNNQEVFYVGCSINPNMRETEHTSLNRCDHFSSIRPTKYMPVMIQYIVINQIKPVLEVIDQIETNEPSEALALESFWIELMRSWNFPLTNQKGFGYRPNTGYSKNKNVTLIS